MRRLGARWEVSIIVPGRQCKTFGFSPESLASFERDRVKALRHLEKRKERGEYACVGYMIRVSFARLDAAKMTDHDEASIHIEMALMNERTTELVALGQDYEEASLQASHEEECG